MLEPHRLRRSPLLSAALAGLVTLGGASAFAADPVRLEEIVVVGAIDPAERNAELDAARAFYEFWNTGDAAFLKRAIANDFTDHTLPPCRPQGRGGPTMASRIFFAAVPDLRVTVHEMIVAGLLCDGANGLHTALHRYLWDDEG